MQVFHSSSIAAILKKKTVTLGTAIFWGNIRRGKALYSVLCTLSSIIFTLSTFVVCLCFLVWLGMEVRSAGVATTGTFVG